MYSVVHYINLHVISCNLTCHLSENVDLIRYSLAGIYSPTVAYFKFSNLSGKIYVMFPVAHIPNDAIKFEILMTFKPFQKLLAVQRVWAQQRKLQFLAINLHINDRHFILAHGDKREEDVAPAAFAVTSMFLQGLF